MLLCISEAAAFFHEKKTSREVMRTPLTTRDLFPFGKKSAERADFQS
jgi:hypothetical protein